MFLWGLWFTVLAVDQLGKGWRFVDRSLAGGTFDENVTGCDWHNLSRYTTFQKFIIIDIDWLSVEASTVTSSMVPISVLFVVVIWGESVTLIWTFVTRIDWFMLTCDTKSFQRVTWILWLPWATNMSWTCKTLYDKVCGGETLWPVLWCAGYCPQISNHLA